MFQKKKKITIKKLKLLGGDRKWFESGKGKRILIGRGTRAVTSRCNYRRLLVTRNFPRFSTVIPIYWLLLNCKIHNYPN